MPANSNTDDTFATYASDYLIALIGVVAAVAMATNTNASSIYKILSICFFAFTGLGYGIAAVLHQILHEDFQHSLPEHQIWWKLSYIGVLIGSAGLCVLGNHLLPCCEDPGRATILYVLDAIASLIHGAAIVQTMIDPQLLVTGALTAVVMLYLLVVWAVRAQWVKAVAMLFCVGGMIVQITLSSSCGDAAYESCFAECPLPAPYFNHNALFHVLYAIGLLIVGVAMCKDPDLLDGYAIAKD
jgi:hypothetical protein